MLLHIKPLSCRNPASKTDKFYSLVYKFHRKVPLFTDILKYYYNTKYAGLHVRITWISLTILNNTWYGNGKCRFI